jgi:hypothetical protein
MSVLGIEIPDFITEFEKNNPWFDKDKAMTDFMYRTTQSLVRDESIPLEDALGIAHKIVQARYPSATSGEEL